MGKSTNFTCKASAWEGVLGNALEDYRDNLLPASSPVSQAVVASAINSTTTLLTLLIFPVVETGDMKGGMFNDYGGIYIHHLLPQTTIKIVHLLTLDARQKSKSFAVAGFLPP